MSRIKIAFFGCKPLGEDCLEYLMTKNHKFEVVLVGSNPTSENWWKSNRAYDLAKKSGIAFVDNSRKNESQILEFLATNSCDYLISVQHSWIFSNNIINKFKNAFNLHNAKLPEYKGYNAFSHAILNGDPTYTTTLHHLVPDVDAGDIIFEATIPIDKEETAQSLYHKSNHEAFELFRKLITYLENGQSLPSKKQVGEGSFYNRKSLDQYRDLTDCTDNSFEKKIWRALYFPPFDGPYRIVEGKKEFIKF